MMTENTTGTPEINLDEARNILDRAWSQVELINMAAEAGDVTSHAGDAIAWGCIAVQELLDQVKGYLAECASGQGGGSK